METAEVLRPEEVAESLLSAIETARAKVLARIKRKRKKLVKIVESVGEDFEALVKKWSTSFVTVGLATGIFLTTAVPITAASIPEIRVEEVIPTFGEKEALRQRILDYLEKFGQKRVNEQVLASLVSQITNLPVKVILDGYKIPAIFGEIATERHLKIYPGQALSDHLQGEENFSKFSWTGISFTPSAWGYFAQSKNEATDDLIQKEKYYLAIQTFAADNWNREWPELKEWYKFRKLLVFNPENGKAVIGVIADAGPAKFTGRKFGGSPELMVELEIVSTGNVLVFFLDDPTDLIPLGPVNYEGT